MKGYAAPPSRLQSQSADGAYAEVRRTSSDRTYSLSVQNPTTGETLDLYVEDSTKPVVRYQDTTGTVNFWQLYDKTHKSELIDLVYPVGSIYMSVNSTSPATLFGGTWSQLKDRFLLGAGSSYTNGDTGGAATVTLTTSQIPAHTHVQQYYNESLAGFRAMGYTDGSNSGGSPKILDLDSLYTASTTNSLTTESTGGGGSHNNMPPYLVVYMWKRTA